jgi:hypothetical protein
MLPLLTIEQFITALQGAGASRFPKTRLNGMHRDHFWYKGQSNIGFNKDDVWIRHMSRSVIVTTAEDRGAWRHVSYNPHRMEEILAACRELQSALMEPFRHGDWWIDYYPAFHVAISRTVVLYKEHEVSLLQADDEEAQAMLALVRKEGFPVSTFIDWLQDHRGLTLSGEAAVPT